MLSPNSLEDKIWMVNPCSSELHQILIQTLVKQPLHETLQGPWFNNLEDRRHVVIAP